MGDWSIIKDVFVGVCTLGGGLLANNIQTWLKRIYEQLKSLNDNQIRHDEKISSHHEKLQDHEKRITELEK
jgi:hypothetical protein